jgi:hypothetical protein
MAHWSMPQLISLILKYHPSAGADVVVPAIAIAYAESGGNDHAVGPAHDYGLWQINRIHFGDGIITASNWTSSAVQVAEMWRLSSAGQNWAAWCTAWRGDHQSNCGHGYIHFPEIGSSGYSEIAAASAAWRTGHGTPPPGQAPPALTPEQQDEKAVSAAFNYARKYYSSTAHTQLVALQAAEKAIVRLRP